MKTFKFKNVVTAGKNQSEGTLRECYRKKFGIIVPSLKYIKNIHGIQYLTIFEANYEGLELLKYAKQITIITKYHSKNIKMMNRIKKLKEINKTVNIVMEKEIGFCGGGLLSLIAYANMRDQYLLPTIKSKKIEMPTKKNEKQHKKKYEKNKIRKNINNLQHKGR